MAMNLYLAWTPYTFEWTKSNIHAYDELGTFPSSIVVSSTNLSKAVSLASHLCRFLPSDVLLICRQQTVAGKPLPKGAKKRERGV